MKKYEIIDAFDGLERIIWQAPAYSLHQRITSKHSNVKFCNPIISFFSKHKYAIDDTVKNIIDQEQEGLRFVVNNAFDYSGLLDTSFNNDDKIIYSILISKEYNKKKYRVVRNCYKVYLPILVLHELTHVYTFDPEVLRYPEPFHNVDFWRQYKQVIKLAHNNLFIDDTVYHKTLHHLNYLIKYKIEYHIDYDDELTERQLEKYRLYLDEV